MFQKLCASYAKDSCIDDYYYCSCKPFNTLKNLEPAVSGTCPPARAIGSARVLRACPQNMNLLLVGEPGLSVVDADDAVLRVSELGQCPVRAVEMRHVSTAPSLVALGVLRVVTGARVHNTAFHKGKLKQRRRQSRSCPVGKPPPLGVLLRRRLSKKN